MTSRRSVVKGLGLLAGAAAWAGGATGALAQGAATRATVLGAAAGLGELPASASPAWIDGQGWFEAGPAEGEPDGVLRIAGPDGQHWRRSDFGGVLRPHWFAQAGDDGDDAKAIQRALDHAAARGPFAVDLGGARHACRSRLVIDPTRAALRGVGAVLDFSAMPEPPAAEPLVTLDRLQPGGAWRREGAALVHAEGTEDAITHYLALPDEGRYRVSVVVGEVAGWADYPQLRVEVTASDRSPLGGVTAIGAGRYCFEVDGPQPAARLTVAANAGARVKALEVTWEGRRECVLVQAGEGSPQYGHKWMEGIEVRGPGEATRLHGIRFETRAEARSSRLDLRDVAVVGVHTGLVFSHRAYLVRAWGLRCNASEACLHFLGGSKDAGELISFQGGVLEGARTAILNNGAEFLLDATSIDFVDQVVVGSGQVTLQGCHLEINRPTDPDRPPFDLAWGNVALSGGVFLVTGHDFEAGNRCDHVFRLGSRAATASMQDVTTYNLRTQSGALAGGPGRLDVARLRGRRPRHTAPIVQFGPDRNLLGPLPQEARSSGEPAGALTPWLLEDTGFRVSMRVRCVWLCGPARPGAEVGVAFEIRGDQPGQVAATVQAMRGDARAAIGDRWLVDVSGDWTTFRASTGNTHPSAAGDGRMPDGWNQVALMLDLTGFPGTAEVRDVFLCAV